MSEPEIKPTAAAKFFKDAGLRGGGSVIFAILLFIVAIIEHVEGANISSWLLESAGVLFFCVGTLTAWNEERKKYEKEVARQRKPTFTGDVVKAFIAVPRWFDKNSKHEMENDSFLCFHVRASNTTDIGGPCTVRDYVLTKLEVNGKSYSARKDLSDIGVSKLLVTVEEGRVPTRQPVDPRATEFDPLQYLLDTHEGVAFYIEGLACSLEYKTADVEITAIDVLGNRHSIIGKDCEIIHGKMDCA